MMQPLPLPSTAASRGDAPCSGSGAISAGRVALIRRRIAANRYPVDSAALASELLACDARGDASGAISAVEQLLVAAIDRLDRRAALILQLEFVERLTLGEIAATVDAAADGVRAVRSAALLRIKALLDAG